MENKLEKIFLIKTKTLFVLLVFNIINFDLLFLYIFFIYVVWFINTYKKSN
jgi:hypothetical protein